MNELKLENQADFNITPNTKELREIDTQTDQQEDDDQFAR